MLAQHNLNT